MHGVPLTGPTNGPLDVDFQSWPEALQEALKNAKVVALALAPELVLTRTIRLPLAAETELASVIDLQLDRYLPLQPALAYVDYRVTARDTKSGELEVELAFAQRRHVDPTASMLKEAGLQLVSVGVNGDRPENGEAINFLRADADGRTMRKRRLDVALIGLALLIAVTGQSFIAMKHTSELAVLEERNLALAPQAERIRKLSQELARLGTEQQIALSSRQAFDALRLITDLSERLPDGTWLSQMDITRDKGEVRIMGFSNDATTILALIEGSPHLFGVRFKGPVVKDTTGHDRFEITAQIVPESPS